MTKISGHPLESADEAVITPEMLEAGAETLIGELDLMALGGDGAIELAEMVYQAMAAAAPPVDVLTSSIDSDTNGLDLGDQQAQNEALRQVVDDIPVANAAPADDDWIRGRGTLAPELVEELRRQDAPAAEIPMLPPLVARTAADEPDSDDQVRAFVDATGELIEVPHYFGEKPPCDCPVCTAGRNLFESGQPFIDVNGSGLHVVWRDAFFGDGRLI